MSTPGEPRSLAAALHRQRMLEGPILPTLLLMAWPTMVQMFMYSAVLLLETWFISKLGVTALAGASLVSPASFLMQAVAVGGLGTAVTATIARAAGSGNPERVQALAWHAVLIALACGFVFSLAMLVCGPWFYGLLGGRDGALDAALEYSNVLFMGSPLMWLVIILAAILRGLGVVKLQAGITVVASVILLPLSPVLIFGFGPIPALGMRGAGIAVIIYYALVAALYCAYLASNRSAIRLRLRGLAPSRADFASILGLGGISSLMAVQSHVAALIITGLAGSFGTVALAGFGAALRLQHIVEPFVFSLGVATLVMIASCVGAGDIERARKVALTAATTAAVFCGSIGGFLALFPGLWMERFSQDPQVVAAGALYLRIIGPFYWCMGLGLVMYYCCQGIGRMRWSYAGNLVRLGIVAVAGTVSVSVLHGGINMLYWVVAAAMVISCALMVFGMLASRDWQPQLMGAGAKA